MNQLFSLAFAVLAAESCFRILIGYGKIGHQYAFSVLLPLDVLGGLLLIAAFIAYLSSRLRREESDGVN